MDGTAWDVSLKRQSLFAFSHRHTLTFESGSLTVTGPTASAAQTGYAARAAGSGALTVWESQTSDGRGGDYQWRGLVRGDRIEGTLLWLRPNGTVKRYAFTGAKAG